MKLHSCVATLLVLSLLGGCGKPSPQPLPTSDKIPATIVFATDLHYLSPSLTDSGEGFLARMYNGDGKVTAYVDQIADAFVAQMLASPPDAVVLGGDLTLDGEKESHRDLSAKLKKLWDAGIPVLSLPGNHDVDNYMASGFAGNDRVPAKSIKSKDFLKLYGRFGAQNALSKDKDSMSYFYKVRGDLWVLLLDVNESVDFGGVSENTYRWLEQQLIAAKEQGATVVSASHQNMLVHNPAFVGGYVIEENDRLMALLEQYGVRLNLSGHIHLQHIAGQAEGLQEVVGSALAITPHRYGVVTFDAGTLDYTGRPVDVAGWAKGQGLTDPNLLHFAEYSRQVFWDIANQQSLGNMSDWGIDPEHMAQMAAFYADLNTDYFEGKKATRTANDPAYALCQRYDEGSRHLNYITNMLQSTGQAQDILNIQIP